MTHARQQIREAVKTILSSSPVAWSAVIVSRRASPRQIWPYLMIHMPSDDPVSESSDSPSQWFYNSDLLIEGMLRLPGTGDTSSIEDKFDEVRGAVMQKINFQALLEAVPEIKSLSAPRIETAIVDDEEEFDFGRIVFSYTVGYAIQEGSPETLI